MPWQYLHSIRILISGEQVDTSPHFCQIAWKVLQVRWKLQIFDCGGQLQFDMLVFSATCTIIAKVLHLRMKIANSQNLPELFKNFPGLRPRTLIFANRVFSTLCVSCSLKLASLVQCQNVPVPGTPVGQPDLRPRILVGWDLEERTCKFQFWLRGASPLVDEILATSLHFG